MEPDLLKKEEEYRKENEQLEHQTKQLREKLDVIKNQDNLKNDHFPIESPNVYAAQASTVPKSINDLGTKGLLHYYKAKTTNLQAANESLHKELKKKNDEIQKLTKDLKQVSDEKEKWFLQYTAEKTHKNKLEKQIPGLTSKWQLKDAENNNLKKEIEQCKKELKSSNIERSSAENRLNKIVQDFDKSQEAFRLLKEEDKDAKESHRRQVKELTAALKMIQKEKTELLHGYKKQIQLIDNLKKQNALLEALKLTETLEKDFNKLLDWKVD